MKHWTMKKKLQNYTMHYTRTQNANFFLGHVSFQLEHWSKPSSNRVLYSIQQLNTLRNNIIITHFVLCSFTFEYLLNEMKHEMKVANNTNVKRIIDEKLQMIKIQQQQKYNTVKLNNRKLGKPKYREI